MRRETFAASLAWRRQRSGAVGGQGLESCSFILRFIEAGREMAPPIRLILRVMETSFSLTLFLFRLPVAIAIGR
jgi:hypothetical protein